MRFPILENDAAWQCLPDAETGSGSPLPVWARMLAAPLPRTTAALLELDYLHRAENPLEPALRAKLRYVAADENCCALTRAVALADLCRAGLSQTELAILQRAAGALPFGERRLL